MGLERTMAGKAYKLASWVWNLFVLNILTIFTTAPLITAFPGFVAMAQTIEDLKQGRPGLIIVLFAKNFGKHFKRTVVPGLIIGEVLGLLAYGIFLYQYFYYESGSALFVVGFFVLVTISVVALLVLGQLPWVYVYKYFRIFDNFLYAFIVTFRYFLRSLPALLLFAASMALAIYALPLWVGYGLSLCFFISSLAIRPIYIKKLPTEEGDILNADGEKNETGN